MPHYRLTRSALLTSGAAALAALALIPQHTSAAGESFEVTLSDDEWRKRLSTARYEILRHAGTEPAWSSPLEYEHRHGVYSCAGCQLPLFSSTTKFESGTGWPSFYAPLPNAVRTNPDNSWLEQRNEVHCRRCGGHLGHVFDDGPKPTGLRYCMNGLALLFTPK